LYLSLSPPEQDALHQKKARLLNEHNIDTTQPFALSFSQPVPPKLITFARIYTMDDRDLNELEKQQQQQQQQPSQQNSSNATTDSNTTTNANQQNNKKNKKKKNKQKKKKSKNRQLGIVTPENEARSKEMLNLWLSYFIQQYQTTIEDDELLLKSTSDINSRNIIINRLGEKRILYKAYNEID